MRQSTCQPLPAWRLEKVVLEDIWVLGTDHPATYTIVFVCVVEWSAAVIAIIIARVTHAETSEIARCKSECYLPSCLHYECDLSQLLQQTILSQINPTLLTSSTRVQPLTWEWE